MRNVMIFIPAKEIYPEKEELAIENIVLKYFVKGEKRIPERIIATFKESGHNQVYRNNINFIF